MGENSRWYSRNAIPSHIFYTTMDDIISPFGTTMSILTRFQIALYHAGGLRWRCISDQNMYSKKGADNVFPVRLFQWSLRKMNWISFPKASLLFPSQMIFTGKVSWPAVWHLASILLFPILGGFFSDGLKLATWMPLEIWMGLSLLLRSFGFSLCLFRG